MNEHLKEIIQKTICSRKAMASLTILIFSSLALWAGKLNSPEYVDLIQWILGSYLIGQAGVDIATKLKKE